MSFTAYIQAIRASTKEETLRELALAFTQEDLQELAFTLSKDNILHATLNGIRIAINYRKTGWQIRIYDHYASYPPKQTASFVPTLELSDKLAIMLAREAV